LPKTPSVWHLEKHLMVGCYLKWKLTTRLNGPRLLAGCFTAPSSHHYILVLSGCYLSSGDNMQAEQGVQSHTAAPPRPQQQTSSHCCFNPQQALLLRATVSWARTTPGALLHPAAAVTTWLATAAPLPAGWL
jgi:hypothetical protein